MRCFPPLVTPIANCASDCRRTISVSVSRAIAAPSRLFCAMAIGKFGALTKPKLPTSRPLKRTIHRHRHRLSLRNDEFFHFDDDAGGPKFLQENRGDFLRQRLDQLPFAPFAQTENSLN